MTSYSYAILKYAVTSKYIKYNIQVLNWLGSTILNLCIFYLIYLGDESPRKYIYSKIYSNIHLDKTALSHHNDMIQP